MGKEKIRNGGFEDADTRFWEAITANTVLTAQNVTKKRGAYAGKVRVSSGVEASIQHRDLIEVSEDEVYKFSGWFKDEDLGDLVVYVYFYDVGGSYITNQKLYSAGGVLASFTHVVKHFVIPNECSYMRLYFYNIKVPPGVYDWYIDEISLQQVTISELAVIYEKLINVVNETTEHTAYGEEFFTGVWKQAEYYLSCTSLTGTTPTLNVLIQAYDPSVELWKDVIVFQELVAAGAEAKTLLSGLGWKQRVKYTTADAGAKMLSSGLGGKERVKYTTASGIELSDCDFKVGVIYKR